ncbi:MAG: hypothetical protein Fur003_0390 [Candidatus Dojkabacteria bacterium]
MTNYAPSLKELFPSVQTAELPQVSPFNPNIENPWIQLLEGVSPREIDKGRMQRAGYQLFSSDFNLRNDSLLDALKYVRVETRGVGSAENLDAIMLEKCQYLTVKLLEHFPLYRNEILKGVSLRYSHLVGASPTNIFEVYADNNFSGLSVDFPEYTYSPAFETQAFPSNSGTPMWVAIPSERPAFHKDDMHDFISSADQFEGINHQTLYYLLYNSIFSEKQSLIISLCEKIIRDGDFTKTLNLITSYQQFKNASFDKVFMPEHIQLSMAGHTTESQAKLMVNTVNRFIRSFVGRSVATNKASLSSVLDDVISRFISPK